MPGITVYMREWSEGIFHTDLKILTAVCEPSPENLIHMKALDCSSLHVHLCLVQHHV